MKMRWKRIVAVLGVVTMISYVPSVEANELPTNPETTEETDEIGSVEDALDGEKAEEETTEAESGEKDAVGTPGNAADGNIDEEDADAEESNEENPALLSAEAAETAENSGEVQAVINLGWSEETPGRAVFYNPNEGEVSFSLGLYKDGVEVARWSGSADLAGEVSISTDMDIEQSGNYTYRVKTFPHGVLGDFDFSTGCVSEVSPSFVYTRPNAQVEVPKNINCTPTGYVSWDAVDNAYHYWSELSYIDDRYASGYYWVSRVGSSSLSQDYSEYLASGYDYYVRVKANSSNINLYAHSGWSDYIPVNTTEASNSVNGKLDEYMDGLTEETAESAVKKVIDAFAGEKKKELQTAMQTSAGTQSRISELEEKYKAALGGVETGFDPGDTGIDTSGMKLLGAALNATGSGRITFNMSKVDEETQKDLLTHTQYTNAIVLDFDLVGAGIEKGQALDIPVTVTMPAPEGMNPYSLTILHYNADRTSYENLQVRQNGDGTISFTVTHFSYFAFVENETPSSGGSSSHGSSSEVTYSSENGSSAANVYVESWKPTTPDEIKRYSVVGKEKAVFTVNSADSYPVTVINAMQGKLCFDSFEAVLGDYTIGRTYNILPGGKMVYKMDKKAKITLNIPAALRKEGRDFRMICVTKNGLPVVLNDLDTDPNTITFETDTYYAFALVYKDAAVSK